MTDLDEREEGIDAILRASGTSLRTAMAHAPIPDFRRPRGSVRRRWVIAVATVGVLIAGLIAIGTGRNDQSVGNDPSRLHWLVANPPDGLGLVMVSAPGTQTGPAGETVNVSAYATESAPLGPILMVSGSAGAGLELTPAAGGSNFQETVIDGRRAALADGDTGRRLLYIEVDGHWAVLTSRNIDDATLSKMAAAVVRNADGSAVVPTTALLDGLTLVLPPDAPISDLNMGSNFSGLSYANPDGRSIGLQVYPTRLSARAMFGLQANLTATKVKGADGFVGAVYSIASSEPRIEVHLLSWQRDGLEFRITGFNVGDAQVMAAAESVEPASDAKWSEMLQQTGADQGSAGVAPAATVPAELVPPGTDPPFTGEVKDVSMDLVVTDTSANEQTWSGTLPTGENWKVEVKRVFDSISLQPEVDGVPQGMSYGPVLRPTGQEIACCGPLNVITADSTATALRVTTHDGDRFTLPLHDLPGTGGLRIATVALANGSGPQLAELLDADGNVLASQP